MKFALPLLALLSFGVPSTKVFHGLKTHITPGANGTFVVAVEVLAPENGERVAATKVEMRPGARTLRASHGEHAFAIHVNIDRNGRGLAKLEVTKEGERRHTATTLIEVQPPAGYVRVSDVAKGPRVIQRVPPHYPEKARAARVTGVVILDARIDTNGRVKDAVILTEPGHGLGEEAAKAVRQWTFAPQEAPVAFLIPVQFKLN